MKKLLLHVCCAPCSTAVIEALKKEYEITLFFYNPNIEPEKEYKLRLDQAEKLSQELDLDFIHGEYEDNEPWHQAIKGHEDDEEGGERCDICFSFRLQKAAILAKGENFDFFTTTLTISPHKNSEIINRIGKELAELHKTKFLEQDFKKDYKKSIQLSKDHNLYRQKYCGCLYSKN